LFLCIMASVYKFESIRIIQLMDELCMTLLLLLLLLLLSWLYGSSLGRLFSGESLQALVKNLRDSYIPLRRNWMVLFPEGGFLRKRRETSQRFALRNNWPVLQHECLCPEWAHFRPL
jgi:hypothetical protein